MGILFVVVMAILFVMAAVKTIQWLLSPLERGIIKGMKNKRVKGNSTKP